MTYKLPFGLKQKPVNHLLDMGEIRFSCRDEKLYYKAIAISKKTRFTVAQGLVIDKDHLDYLLSVKSFPLKIRSIEEVVQQ